MNPVATTALVALAVVSLLWTALLIPVLLELRRASWRLQEFIRLLEIELRPVIQEARDAIRNLNKAAVSAAEGTEQLRGALGRFREAGENVRTATGKIRAVFGYRFIPAASLLAGVQAGAKMLWKLYTRRRETS